MAQANQYNDEEISRAKNLLMEDMKTVRMQNLKRRLNFGETFPNMWEGEEGWMEHVTCPFPMPGLVEGSDENSDNCEHQELNQNTADCNAEVHGHGSPHVSSPHTPHNPSEHTGPAVSSSQNVLKSDLAGSYGQSKNVPNASAGQPHHAEHKAASTSASPLAISSVGEDYISLSSLNSSSASSETKTMQQTTDVEKISSPATFSERGASESPDFTLEDADSLSLEELQFWQKVNSLHFELFEIREQMEKYDITTRLAKKSKLNVRKHLKSQRSKVKELSKQFSIIQQERAKHGYTTPISGLQKCLSNINRQMKEHRRQLIQLGEKQQVFKNGKKSAQETSSNCSDTTNSSCNDVGTTQSGNRKVVCDNTGPGKKMKAGTELAYWKGLEDTFQQLKDLCNRMGKLKFKRITEMQISNQKLTLSKLEQQFKILKSDLEDAKRHGIQMGFPSSRVRPERQTKKARKRFVTDLKQVNNYCLFIGKKFRRIMRQIQNVEQVS